MTAPLQDEFDHFGNLNVVQLAELNALAQKIAGSITDDQLAALVSAGIVQATQDKIRAARIIAGILTFAKVAKGILGF
jgi:hypothetical protein